MKTISRTTISLVVISILLAACTASTAGKLEGTKWNLVLLQADGKTVDLSQANQITLEFGDKGAISGSAGCNSYFGTMEFKSNENINVKDVGSTEMYCMKGMEVETAYLDVLRQGGTLSLEGNNPSLTITSPGGQSLIVFVKADS